MPDFTDDPGNRRAHDDRKETELSRLICEIGRGRNRDEQPVAEPGNPSKDPKAGPAPGNEPLNE